MPIYPYRCTECGYEFELISKMDEKRHSPMCPNCECDVTEDMVSPLNFRLVGKFS